MAAARTMKDAVSSEDFDLWDKGLKPQAKVPEEHPEPKPPKVDNLIKLDKIKTDELESITKGRRHIIRNEQGVIFIGYDIGYKVKGRKQVDGWMPEVDYVDLRRILFREGLINVDSLEY